MPNPFILAVSFVVGVTVLGFLFYTNNVQYENNHYDSSSYADNTPYRSTWNDNASQRRDNVTLPSRKRKKKDDDCVVCMKPLSYENAGELSCGHKFHIDCIRKWFKQYEQCPLCWSEFK